MLDPLYHLAANAIVFFHKGFGPIFGNESFFSWAFSVVLLVVCVRIVIFPLFVKQVKSQRTMQMLQPRIKEIREKYGHDKPRMQNEIMALQKEHGNPLLGCLPILLQIPLFIALFHVFNSLVPKNINGHYQYVPRVGLSAHQVQQIAEAKLWGVSLSTAFTSKTSIIDFLNANAAHIKIFAVVLIVLMGATTFFTQKQIIGRQGPVDPQQQMVQKVMLYGSPLFLAVFGFRFPVAVLLYWLTTNLWSMGQQFFVIRRMPPVEPLGPGGKLPGATKGAPAKGGPAKGAKAAPPQVSVAKPAPGVKPAAKGPKAAAARAAAGEGKEAAGAGGAARRPSRAPAGTSSRSGKAAGSSANGRASEAGAANVEKPAGTDASVNGAGSVNGTGGASGKDDAQAATPASAGGGRQPSVAAGARRPPGGSRPAKKRGKGQRRGGRR